MHERIHLINHHGKQVLVVDLSNCSAVEVDKIARAVPEFVTTRPRGSVLILSDFTGASFDEEAVRAMKESAVFDKPYVKRSAWVGADSFPDAFRDRLKRVIIYLTDFYFPGREEGTEHFAMLYHAYIDDSADSKRERIVVAGAIIGKKADWDNLNRRWNSRLAEDEIQYYKSSHCETLNGQFHKFRKLGMEEGHRKADKVREDLDAIIHTSPLTGLGVTLSVPFHQTMLSDPQKFGEIPYVPYRLAFQQLIAECGKAMQLLGRGNVVTFGHDDSGEFHVLHDLYKDFKRRNPRYSGMLYDFVPLDDKLHPPVQAADVAAWITLQFANNYLKDPSGQNMQRLKRSMYKIVNWLDAAQPWKGPNTEDAPAKAVYAP